MAEPKNGPTTAPATKMEAVQRTLQKLGQDAMPLAIKDHVKKQYNIEISAAVASDYKKQLKKKAKDAAKPRAAKPVAAPAAPTPAATPAPKAAAPVKKMGPSGKRVVAAKIQAPAPQAPRKVFGTPDGSILLEDVLTVKALPDRVGADKLRR